jgi:hypothetical protein
VADARQIGWREVLIVAAVAVGIVLVIEVMTTIVPGLRDTLNATPLLAIVLIVVTAWSLWRIATRHPPDA